MSRTTRTQENLLEVEQSNPEADKSSKVKWVYKQIIKNRWTDSFTVWIEE